MHHLHTDSSNKAELQKQIKLLDDNLRQEITSSQENTQSQLKKQIDDVNNLGMSNNEEIKTKIDEIDICSKELRIKMYFDLQQLKADHFIDEKFEELL